MLSPPFMGCSSLQSLDSASEDIPSDFDNFNGIYLRPDDELPKFLTLHLTTPRLNSIYQHLWLVGYPKPVRPLYMQKIMRREIIVTEDPEEHLLYENPVIFIKRMPSYLSSHEFWEQNICGDESLYQSAVGMLLSYTWLIRYKSDFHIARKHYLIPEGFGWKRWKSFTADFLNHYQAEPGVKASQRFHYGELRMSALIHIGKFNPALNSLLDRMNNLLRSPWWYRPFIKRNLSRLLAVFVFFSLILSAMQVGLAVDRLHDNAAFIQSCYVFAVTCMLIVLFGALILLMAWALPSLYVLIKQWRMTQTKIRAAERRGHSFKLSTRPTLHRRAVHRIDPECPENCDATNTP